MTLFCYCVKLLMELFAWKPKIDDRPMQIEQKRSRFSIKKSHILSHVCVFLRRTNNTNHSSADNKHETTNTRNSLARHSIGRFRLSKFDFRAEHSRTLIIIIIIAFIGQNRLPVIAFEQTNRTL